MPKPLERAIHRLFYYEDGDLYRKVRTSNQHKVRDRVGWSDKGGYRRVEIDGMSYGVHRLVFLMHYGYLPNEIDHINGVKDDNHIENLRECTHAENLCNSSRSASSITGVKGVTFDKSKGKYVARITVNKRLIHLGAFDDLELAELVISEARDKYHKEFANDG